MKSLPRSDLEKQAILSKIAKEFGKGKRYSEFEVNDILKSLKIEDISLIRRELVNFKYLGKDSTKGIYWLQKIELSNTELKEVGENQKRVSELR